MIMRALDTDHDWTFGQGLTNYNRDQKAIAENVQTRLYSFLNDCFFDLAAGIDWFRLLGTKGTQNEILLNCKAIVLQSYGVVRVNSMSVNVTETRRIFIEMNIDTIYTRNFSQLVVVDNG